ncbi:SWIM zinc finger family protein [uncultured Actinomyces sp.]|uniref:SWIM zinc finger family protein n=1 Tax=uncultured Actinomyces sp. TaxID=249061 RepID=UPI00288AB699|nr:SWIM zinc finger family protein [uncultured Actinomyces sp.]
MAEDWNAQRVTSLAPDAKVAAAGLKLAKTGTWSDVGYHESLLWGQCKGSGKNPYQVCADLAASAFRCSCPSRKFPCKHAVGLLHLWCDGAAAPGEPVEFARQWAERRAERAAKAAERAAGTAPAPDADPATAAKRAKAARARAARREQRVTDGLADLDRWILDQIDQGLVATGESRSTALRRLAARMVDAQAPGVAARLGELATLDDKDPDWLGELASELGAIHLLARAWAGREHLPADLVACARREIGLSVASEEVLAAPGVEDRWAVVGTRDREEGRVTARDFWLCGTSTGRWGRIIAYAREAEELPTTFSPGTLVQARLHFHPGPGLRALSRPEQPAAEPIAAWNPGALSVAGAREAWRNALAADPWADVRPLLVAGRLAANAEGHLALSPRETDGERADRGHAALPLLRIGIHRRLALAAACDNVVIAGLICPQGLWPLSLLTGGTVVPL